MRQSYRIAVLTLSLGAFALCPAQFLGFGKKKKYDTPVTNNSQQPDKLLFDKAIKDIEKGNYEIARLTLNTLMNTYDTSEYLAKAKLAVADSFYREGGAHGLAQAEQEYKDFELFYPQMEEAAESQYKVCEIHFKQLEKADRDSSQAQRAEDECRAVKTQYPNSKFIPKADQMLRETQEVLADKEFKTGEFYHGKGSFPAAANRMSYVTQQYPSYSGSDDALWELADSYKHMGDRFEKDETNALTKIVRDYPLSGYLDLAKERLTELKQPIPQADPKAYERMKYDLENQKKPGIVSRMIEPFASRPDTSMASKAGAPVMTSLRPPTPVSVPNAPVVGGATNGTGGTGTGVSDVTASVVGTDEIDKQKDARLGTAGGAASGGASGGTAEVPAAQPLTAEPTSPSTPSGSGENPASVGSNGQKIATDTAAKPAATPVINQALPTNHPLTMEQLKILKKQAEKAAKNQKKHPNAAPVPAAVTPTVPGATAPGTPAAAATTPAAPVTTTPHQ